MNEKAQNAMEFQFEELRDFVENASLPLHWVDKNGIIVWANQAELDMLGYTHDEYVGMPLNGFHVDQHIVNDILVRLINNETLLNYNARLKCKDGAVKHVQINSNVYRKNKEFMHTRCFTRDISDLVLEAERKTELVRRLEESEEQLKMSRDIIASSFDAIISKDLNGIVTSWNKSAETTFSYTADEMIGKPISILMPADRISEEHEIYSRLRNGEEVRHFETKRITKHKRTLDVSLTISPIKDKAGNIIGLSKIVRDITEKKQEEARKDSFVSIASHELKTPLTSILAYAQMLLTKTRKAEDTFITSALVKIEIQAKKMTSMVQNFLNVGRLDAGKIQINKEPFDLNPLIQEIVEDLSLITTTHTIKYAGCESVQVSADKDKIGQVLTNLISNAIKYSPKKDKIMVLCKKEVDYVTISVIDKGIGISPKDQTNLFERYYRVENEAASTISGFGVGLYLVAEILKLHDTTIQVTSMEDVGSTFSFRLPTL